MSEKSSELLVSWLLNEQMVWLKERESQLTHGDGGRVEMEGLQSLEMKSWTFQKVQVGDEPGEKVTWRKMTRRPQRGREAEGEGM